MLKWDQKYELGILSIDEQHKKWIALMNQLLEVAATNQDKIGRTLESLIKLEAYTEYHFEYEEKLFATFGYLDTQNHEQRHRDFRSKLSKFKKDAESDNLPIVTNLLIEMKNWLIQHICNEDKKYVELFKSKGLI